MTIQYDGVHSINLWNGGSSTRKNTWQDFHLIPKSRPYIQIPEPNVTIVDIPGTSKRIDITEYIDPRLTFGKRIGDWEFIIAHDAWNSWSESYNALIDYIHGGDIVVSLSDDSDYYYSGVLTISNYAPERDYSSITIHYELGAEPVVGPDGFYPIKFLLQNGQSYLQNYGLIEGSSYWEPNGVLVLDDLFVMSIG